MQNNRIPPQKRPMTEAKTLRSRKLRRAAIKRQKRRRTLFLTACGLAAVLLIAGIVLLCRSCGHTEGRSHNESIYGSFAMSDKSCVYTFREDGSGELRLSGAPYRFTADAHGQPKARKKQYGDALTDLTTAKNTATTRRALRKACCKTLL